MARILARDGLPNARYKTLLQMRLEQNRVYTGGGGLLRHILVGIGRNKDNRRRDIALTQTSRHIQPIHVGQFVIDHQAVDFIGFNGSQQRHGGAEGTDLEAMGLEKKP